jgi:multidrug efflux pump
LTLFLTPVLYNLMAGYSHPRSAVERRLASELATRATADAPAGGG